MNHHHLSHDMRFPTMWYVQPAKPQISLRILRSLIRAFTSCLNSLTAKLLTEQDKEAAQACLSPFMSKCHSVGNHMSRLTFRQNNRSNLWSCTYSTLLAVSSSSDTSAAAGVLFLPCLADLRIKQYQGLTLYSIGYFRSCCHFLFLDNMKKSKNFDYF